MRKRALIFSLIVVFSLSAVSFVFGSGKNLFVIVTTGDDMAQLMSLVLAAQSRQKGADVEVLLCGEAGALAVNGSVETFFKPINKSPQMLLKNLISQGAVVGICPLYLPNRDKTETDLINGVVIAEPPQIADRILDVNTTVLTY